MAEVNVAQTPRGYTYNVENPPLSSTGDINKDPSVMWKVVEREGSILGFFEPCWYGIYTGRQAVPENDTGAFNFMISPKQDDFSTPESLTIAELATAMRFVSEFINSERRLAGFNISTEVRSRRDQVQSWANFHIHCLNLPDLERMEPVFKTPNEYREKLMALTSRLAIKLLTPIIEPDEGIVIDPIEVQTDLALPKSGLLLRLSDNITPQQTAALIKKLDAGFRTSHQEVYDLFVKNYGQKDAAGNTLPYELRSPNEIRALIDSSRFDKKLKKSLVTVAKVLKPENDIESSQKIFQLPSYSLDILRDKAGHLYILLLPYVLKRLGVEKAVGIYPNSRLVEKTSNEKRKQRAKEAFSETVEKIT